MRKAVSRYMKFLAPDNEHREKVRDDFLAELQWDVCPAGYDADDRPVFVHAGYFHDRISKRRALEKAAKAVFGQPAVLRNVDPDTLIEFGMRYEDVGGRGDTRAKLADSKGRSTVRFDD
jgi:hypothetical protein